MLVSVLLGAKLSKIYNKFHGVQEYSKNNSYFWRPETLEDSSEGVLVGLGWWNR